VLRGAVPELRGFPTWDAELDGIVEQVRAWDGDSTAVCVPERRMVADVEARLAKEGIVACAITADGPRYVEAPVHVGTMHRFKGLEYQNMIIAGVAEGLVPAARITRFREDDPLRYRRDLRTARSLLFVAVTLARDNAVITWHGTKSEFLP
jgi:superfamily I DNA/RNA helicase